MNHVKTFAASMAVLLSSWGLQATAASSAASSASDGVSTSVGASSNSIHRSSDSSSRTQTTAAGNYQLMEVSDAAERPGMVRLALQAVADQTPEGAFYLYLPQQAFNQSRLALGQVVTARERPYGTEFSRGDTQQAFFLVLHDDWYLDLPSHPVVL